MCKWTARFHHEGGLCRPSVARLHVVLSQDRLLPHGVHPDASLVLRVRNHAVTHRGLEALLYHGTRHHVAGIGLLHHLLRQKRQARLVVVCQSHLPPNASGRLCLLERPPDAGLVPLESARDLLDLDAFLFPSIRQPPLREIHVARLFGGRGLLLLNPRNESFAVRVFEPKTACPNGKNNVNM